jgi:hypothetical protein
MTHYTYSKGSRVRVVMFQINPLTALAGMQPKYGASRFVFDGTVQHIRVSAPDADDPRIWVTPDAPLPDGLGLTMCPKCGCLEVPMLHPDMIFQIPDTKE